VFTTLWYHNIVERHRRPVRRGSFLLRKTNGKRQHFGRAMICPFPPPHPCAIKQQPRIRVYRCSLARHFFLPCKAAIFALQRFIFTYFLQNLILAGGISLYGENVTDKQQVTPLRKEEPAI